MKIVQASISENKNTGWDGKAKAGDQTGKEVSVTAWYSNPWHYVLRTTLSEKGKEAAEIAIKLAQSNLVGYDQSERNTLYQALKKHNFDVDKYIKSGQKTECDCSSFIYAVYACIYPSIRSDANAPTTSTMLRTYNRWGFTVLTNVNVLNGIDLAYGDILLLEGSHTAIVCPDLTIDSSVQEAIDVIARDVIKGNWGFGLNRKELLVNTVQQRVNEILKGN